MRKISFVSIALVCLVALSLIYGLATVRVCHADNAKPYSLESVEPQDNPRPYGLNPIFKPRDNPRPY